MNFEKIRNIANNKINRALATGLLVLAGKTSMATPEGESVNKGFAKESSSEANKSSISSETAYVVSPAEIAEAAESNVELAKVDFDINYETDKADLHEESKEEIIRQFASFLGDINNDNFKAIEKADWKVVSSCDERPTTAWGEKGNEALATARGEAVIGFLKEYLQNYQFSGLSPEQIKILKDKEIENSIVVTHEDRKGETLIQDIINPATGLNYTEAEVEEIKKKDSQKYLDLLAQNRISQFRAEIPLSKAEEIKEKHDKESVNPLPELDPSLKKIGKTNVPKIVSILPDYKNVVLLFDDSPSMVDDKKILSEEMDENKVQLAGNKLFIGHYSDKLEKIEEVSLDKVNESLLEVIGKGSYKEAAVRSLAQAWNKIQGDISPDEKTLILVNTDEALQDISPEDMESIQSLPANVEVRFIMHRSDKSYLDIPLSIVQKNFEDIIKKRTLGLTNSLSRIEGDLQNLSERLLKAANKEEEKKLEKMMDNLQKRQKECIDKLVDANEHFAGKNVTISQLKDEKGDIIQLYIN